MMKISDCGKYAICGVNGQEITVSRYNYKCPCLNCMDCGGNQKQCPWRYVFETDPGTNEDMRAVVCQNCIKELNEATH